MSKKWSVRNVQAFTLIELLVVIGIIAILMAMLVPMASGVLDRARETMCANNQKQLALACINYAGDHDGQLPNNKEWVLYSGANNAWYSMDCVTNGTVYPYVKDIRMYMCPTFHRIVRSAYPGPTRSYGMNFRVDLKTSSDGGINNVLTMGSVRRTAGCVLLTEENPPYAPWFPATINGVRVGINAVNDGRMCWANGTEFWTSASVRDSPGTYHRNSSAMAAFFDGHAENFTMDENSKWKYRMEPMAP